MPVGQNESTLHYLLPECLQNEIFHQPHTLRTAGHLRKTRTYKKIHEKYYWGGMSRDISQWCQFCKVCTSLKLPHGRHRAELSQMLCGEPLDRCAIDFIGPLPHTFAKYTEAYPLPNQTAATTAKALGINSFLQLLRHSQILSSVNAEFCRFAISIDSLNAKESSIRLVCCLPVCFSSTLGDSNTGSYFWPSQIQMTHSY